MDNIEHLFSLACQCLKVIFGYLFKDKERVEANFGCNLFGKD